jgi:CRISPR-associated protein Csy1
MLDPAIQTFLAERKTAWLKTKLKDCKTEDEQRDIEQQANEKFALENWLPDAAKRAGWLAMVSHCGKFTHPSAKISTVIAEATNKPDGLLRTGNIDSELDVLGNAAALDVYKFLSLSLSDGQTLLSHLEQNTDTIQQQFSFANTDTQADVFNLETNSYTDIQQGLLAIKQSSELAKTSEKIKQVYFPVPDGYHLLSLLTPSGILFKLKKRIDEIRFPEGFKDIREARKNGLHHEQGYAEFYNLTKMGFGGANKQNISKLNNDNQGIAYLLPSFPPTLQERVRKPQSNFFSQVLYRDYQDSFQSLHKLYKTDYNNIDIRDGIDNCLNFIIESILNEQIIERMWQLRELEPDWSKDTQLSQAQKIWLDNGKDDIYLKQRENEDDWLTEIITNFATWLIESYKAIAKEQAISFDSAERSHYKKLIANYQEELR